MAGDAPEGFGTERIAIEQNAEVNLRRLAATRHYYGRAKQFQLAGVTVSLLLALISPVIVYVWPSLATGLAAVGGVWGFASRLVLTPQVRELVERGAYVQDLFDRAVFGLPGRPMTGPSEEEIHRASTNESLDMLREWYPTEARLAAPTSVLMCQRSSVVWGRRLDLSYARVVGSATAACFTFGLAVSGVTGATLAAYLFGVLCPTLPAFLDARDLIHGHLSAAAARQRIRERIGRLLAGRTADGRDLDDVQRDLFTLRRSVALVPDWFYRRFRRQFEEDMRYASMQVR